MMDHRSHDLEGHCGDMGACQRGLSHMARLPDRRSQHLGRQFVRVYDGYEVAHDVHAGLTDVVEAADEGCQE